MGDEVEGVTDDGTKCIVALHRPLQVEAELVADRERAARDAERAKQVGLTDPRLDLDLDLDSHKYLHAQ